MGTALTQDAQVLYAKLGGIGSHDARVVRALLHQRADLLKALVRLRHVAAERDPDWLGAAEQADAAITLAKKGSV